MHHRMPPSKTGWPSLNVAIFPPVIRLVLDDPRISSKWIAEQLCISHEWVGSIIHEDLDVQKYSAKWVLKCLNANQKHQWCSSHLSKFWNFFGAIQMISCHDWWPGTKPGYITMTRRQNNNHSIAPKNWECKNPLEKFSPRFFGIKTASSSLIIFQRAKLSMQSITHLCWCNWRTFWRINAAGRSPRGSCSCTAVPRLTGHLQPRRTWASIVLIIHPILRIWPCLTATCSLDWKNSLKVAIFRPTWRSLLPRRPGWTDNFLNFFWVASKS